ncbi:hypothetical protein [Paracoccus sp. (in: a-proteobacteria)]|uniref:hypothetical protein n=1 Tax=Paracoccus sp. TaxID=267 RepID=UPI00391B1161
MSALSRATLGEVLLARAGGSLLENGCLYEACFAFAGVFRPVLTARFREFVVAWEFTGSNGILPLAPVRKILSGHADDCRIRMQNRIFVNVYAQNPPKPLDLGE